MKERTITCLLAVMLAVSSIGFAQSGSEGEAADLAQKVQNPVSDLISLPFQNNTNFGIGEYDRIQNVLNIQPVIPVSAGNWKILNRIIAPLIYQPYIDQESDGKFGLGDITWTAWLSPAAAGKVVWGAGAVAMFPTGTDDMLGTGKWGLGPSVVLVAMPSPWVVGVLAQNVWSVAGDTARADVNQMVIQYFINFNLPGGWYFTTSPIITANWEAESGNQWLVPFGLGVGKLFAIGSQPLNASIHGYYNAINYDTTPYPEWTLRVQLQFLFPK